MTVEILNTPSQIPGYKMLETIQDMVRIAVSTNVTISSANTAATLFRVPANTFVNGAWVEIVTAFDGTFTSAMGLSLGDSDDADALVSGLEPSSVTATFTSGGLAKNYTAAQDIILTPAGFDAITAGAVRVWLQFRTNSDKQETYNT